MSPPEGFRQGDPGGGVAACVNHQAAGRTGHEFNHSNGGVRTGWGRQLQFQEAGRGRRLSFARKGATDAALQSMEINPERACHTADALACGERCGSLP